MKKQQKKIVILFSLFFLLVFSLLQTTKGKNFFLSILAPTQKIFYSCQSRFAAAIRAGEGKAPSCPEKNWQTKILEAKNKTLQQENQSLKEELNFISQNSYLQGKKDNFVSSYVISKDPFDQSVLIIEAGANKGIKKGMPVIKGNGILIGKIIKTEKNFSYFRLITDDLSEVSASFLSDKKVQIDGIVQGSYNLALLMKFIPLNKKIKKGDIVITSGADKYIPRGLIIGKVVNIMKKDDGIFQTAQLAPPLPLSNIYLATIIK